MPLLVGRVGIEHVLLHEEGLVAPGEVIIGASYMLTGHWGFCHQVQRHRISNGYRHIWMKVPDTIRFNYVGEHGGGSGARILYYMLLGISVDGALYAAMEFGGGVDHLSPSRFTMANMAIEAGAKAGLFYADEKINYVKAYPEAFYGKQNRRRIYQGCYDVSNLEPQ